MIISIGFMRSSNQVYIQDFKWNEKKLSSRIVDTIDLVDENLIALYLSPNEDYSSLISVLEKEQKSYPILDALTEKFSFEDFETMTAKSFSDRMYQITHQWTLQQSLKSLENIYSFTRHLKDLWLNDRTTFFEEFWYFMKKNLASTELSLFFNDVTMGDHQSFDPAYENEFNQTKASDHKKEKLKLVQTVLTGQKKCHFREATSEEKKLMQSYIDKTPQSFEVTEFSPEKGQFVAMAQIDKSPILIMSRTLQFNQLQKSLLTGVFNGLQPS